MTATRSVVMVVPADVDDPARPSGGNVYDQRLCQELRGSGWAVSWRPVALGEPVAGLPDGALVLVDGLVAGEAPDVMLALASRVRVVVLVHMPLGLEGAVLRASAAVVTTSEWCRRWLLTAYALEPGRVVSAPPGADRAELSPGTTHGGNLLCVASVTPGKGHDVLLAALSRLRHLAWECECVGALGRDPGFVARVREDVRCAGLSCRLTLAGPRTGNALEASFRAADLLVLPTRAEAWGMVVTEALAHGLPVVASDVDGVPEALGATTGGVRPGVLVQPGDERGLADALRDWLTSPDLRAALRSRARERRAQLPGWDTTADRVAALLEEVAA